MGSKICTAPSRHLLETDLLQRSISGWEWQGHKHLVEEIQEGRHKGEKSVDRTQWEAAEIFLNRLSRFLFLSSSSSEQLRAVWKPVGCKRGKKKGSTRTKSNKEINYQTFKSPGLTSVIPFQRYSEAMWSNTSAVKKRTFCVLVIFLLWTTWKQWEKNQTILFIASYHKIMAKQQHTSFF